MCCKVWMVSGVALNTYAPALLRHAKDKGPTIFRIEVCICHHEEALVLLKLDIAFQIFKNLPCMKLLHFCITTHSCSCNSQPFQIAETTMKLFLFRLSRRFLWTSSPFLSRLLCFNSQYRNTSKEYFDDRFHIVHKHLLEISLVLREGLLHVIVPHFQQDDLINFPILALMLEFL